MNVEVVSDLLNIEQRAHARWLLRVLSPNGQQRIVCDDTLRLTALEDECRRAVLVIEDNCPLVGCDAWRREIVLDLRRTDSALRQLLRRYSKGYRPNGSHYAAEALTESQRALNAVAYVLRGIPRENRSRVIDLLHRI